MKALVSSWVLGVALVVPTAVILVTVELLHAVPAFSSPRLARTRRVLTILIVILLAVMAAVILARFHYLRT